MEGEKSKESLKAKEYENGGGRSEAGLWQLFMTFLKIGSFTIGGGYAMIPLISDELQKKGWMTAEELPDIIALAQGAPGIIAVNMSVFVGYRLRGLAGAIVATLGSILTSFVVILLIAMVFSSFRDNETVIRIFKGIRPVVAALILVPMINMARKSNKTWWAWAISAATLVLVGCLEVSPVYIILTIIVIAASISAYRERRSSHD